MKCEKSSEINKHIEYSTARTLSFVLPVTIMFVIFILKGIYPFGERCFLSTDLYHQYLPFFSEFVRSVKSGDGIFFDRNVGIGSNFLALYVYYLASPVHWLGLLVPEEYLIEFLSYLVIVKIGLCGLTCFLYLSRQKPGEPDGKALFFSCCYALSGYLAAYNWNIMWLDCVILLPLITLGLERLVREGKTRLYCLTLALSILTNYYISIMICIFMVMYFLFLYCTEKHPGVSDAVSYKRRLVAHVRPFAQFAFYSLLAAGMASILLIPEVCAILRTDFGKVAFTDEVKSYFSVLDMLARHCLSVYVEKGLDHWPNIYCGVGVFLFLPLYALNGKIPARKRFGMLAMAGFLLLGFSTNILNFMWHGLNYPDSLPARQSFIYIFLVLIMCYEACMHLDFSQEKEKETVLRTYLGAVAALLLVEKFIEHEDFSFGVAHLSFLFVTVYAVILYLLYIHRSKRWRVGLLCAALAAVVAETGINTYNTSVSNVSREEYLAGQEDYRSLYEGIAEQDPEFWRVEKFTRKTKNDGCLTGYPTASVFSSTLNSSVMKLYERLGMRHSKVYYAYDGATAFTGALLNVKYLFGESTGYVNSLYSFRGQSGEICLYRSEHTLPFGYVAPVGYDLPEDFTGNAIRLQNQMVKDLGIDELLFEKCSRTKDDTGDDVNFTAPEAGIYYGILTASGTKKIKVTGGSPDGQKFNDLKNGAVVYLGRLSESQRVQITNNDKDDNTPNVSMDIYRMNEEVLDDVLRELSAQHMENVQYDSTGMSGSISLEKPGRMILSIPYEKGWRVKLNGEKTMPELFGGTFMAFDLQPGEYAVEMNYVPEGWYMGLAVSLVSILCLLGSVILERKNYDQG